MNHSTERGKTALVLAGGGLTGFMYEIGALRAIDDLLVDRCVQDFDILVGTSAGAIVAADLANGMSPENLIRVFDGSDPEIPQIKRNEIFSINLREIAQRAIGVPGTLGGVWMRFLLKPNEMTFFDVLWALTQALPSGLYDGMGMEGYVRRLLAATGKPNDFNELGRELYIIATDLDSGDRVVFGPGYRTDVPISMAIAASSAVPGLYKPVRIGDHDYVDGGLRGNASLDLAIERGAKLVVCINPLVPFDRYSEPTAKNLGDGEACFKQRSLQAVASQATRILTHGGLEYHIKQLRRTHPDVDIILIEPSPGDCMMFNDNFMQYSTRLKIAQHGFESVTLNLAESWPYYKEILARHQIPVSRRLVISELKEILDSAYDPAVIQRVLEMRSAACSTSGRSSVVCDLDRALAELDLALTTMTPTPAV